MKEWSVPNLQVAASEDEGEADIKNEWWKGIINTIYKYYI